MDLPDRVPLGWRTDLGVLALDGAVVDPRGDHVVVRTPSSPDYYWGNFVLALTDLEDAERWQAVFEEAFPTAEHRSIGLAGVPADAASWTEAGYEVEHDDVLATSDRPATRDLPDGYEVRALTTDADWNASTALRHAGYPGQQEFEASRTPVRRTMTEAGHTRWFGAFSADGSLDAELGMVDLGGGLGRYQSVLTHPDRRRRGLTGHLLGVAAEWARARGDEKLVIIADATGDAGRLYRAAGFRHVETQAQAFRGPG